MKVSGTHWALFMLIMVLSVSVGIVLAEEYVNKREMRRALPPNTDQ